MLATRYRGFELKDTGEVCSFWVASHKSLKAIGDEGTASMGAFLQIAKRAADEAANNYQNSLQKLSSGTTEKNTQDMGFSIRDTITNAQKQGKNPIEVADC